MKKLKVPTQRGVLLYGVLFGGGADMETSRPPTHSRLSAALLSRLAAASFVSFSGAIAMFIYMMHIDRRKSFRR